MLGPSGVRVLEFYIANSVPINGLIVLYAALLLLARYNLRRIESLAVRHVQQQLDAAGVSPAAAAARKRPPIPGPAWPEILAQGSRFPFVAGAKSWYPRPARPDTMERLLPLHELIRQALAERTAASQTTDTDE